MNSPVSFITQPTRSPDCNVLDLGIWNSLPTIRYDRSSDEPMDLRILKAVMEMWEKYDGFHKLSAIFQTLKAVPRRDHRPQGREQPPRKAK